MDPLDVAAEGADDVDAMHAAAEHEVLGHVQAPGRELVDGAHVVQIEAFKGDQAAQFTFVAAPLGSEELAVEAHRLADEELGAGRAHQIDERAGVLEGGDHGLGADDVFAVAQGGDAGLGVEGVGRIDADHVDIVAGYHVAVVGTPERDVELAGGLLEQFGAAGAGGGDGVAQVRLVLQHRHGRGHVGRAHADAAETDR